MVQCPDSSPWSGQVLSVVITHLLRRAKINEGPLTGDHWQCEHGTLVTTSDHSLPSAQCPAPGLSPCSILTPGASDDLGFLVPNGAIGTEADM